MRNSLILNKSTTNLIKQEYAYRDFVRGFENSSKKELDKKFYQELTPLLKILAKVKKEDREFVISALGKVFELYIENKVEKELNDSFRKALKF